MESSRYQYLRQLPSVDQVLSLPRMKELEETYSRLALVEGIREVLEGIRKTILAWTEEKLTEIRFDPEYLTTEVETRLAQKNQSSLRKAINATGVILHTNLGRAPLSEEALDQIKEVAGGYSTLEIDVETGNRGSRYQHIEFLLCRLTGAEGALIVNNNAAAVLLALSTLAKGREVVISRGQLVEIGGAFRIPEVMEQSGAKLREVGATNKTYLGDYEKVITSETALLLKVHTSNYRILGFTAEVGLEELVELGKKYSLPVMDDLGSGVLLDLGESHLADEPTVANRIKTGVDVVSFSGDKLLGGPQAGILVGKAQYINQMKKNPLTRALRIDKLSLAALEATLRAYLNPQKALQTIPLLEMLSLNLSVLTKRANKLASSLKELVGNWGLIGIEEGCSRAGGGSLPLEDFPTTLVTFQPQIGKLEEWGEELRKNNPPIFTRISKDKIILDPRTIREEEDEEIYQAFRAVAVRIAKAEI